MVRIWSTYRIILSEDVKKLLLLNCTLWIVLISGYSQQIDSSFLNKYPYRIGNIGFSADSMEISVGDIARGEVFKYTLNLYNYGNVPVNFKGGKINRFTTLKYLPVTLSPGQEGILKVDFEAVNELPLGDVHAEIAVDSDDPDSPFKFLYLVGNVVENKKLTTEKLILDTVPRLIFSQYNYDFGYLWRGKNFMHSFNFTNMGSQELVIDKIETSDGISVVKSPKTVIPPGGYGSLVVKVFTFGDFGVQHRTVNISSNDPVNPTITLGVHGTVKAKSPSKQNTDFCYE